MVVLVLGALLIGVAAVLDSLFRFRMQRIGEKWALFRGEAFDYSRYHEARKEQGLAAWPVYIMWVALKPTSRSEAVPDDEINDKAKRNQ